MTLRVNSRRAQRAVAVVVLAALVLPLAACTSLQPYATKPIVLPHRVELSSGDSGILNYTPWYIHTWELKGPAGSG
ncbi:MAG: hypothetical protein QOH33_361, partial [Paraburkholderia sp.]|nr:hypothetical protein [Paraburkholderia sp.]